VSADIVPVLPDEIVYVVPLVTTMCPLVQFTCVAFAELNTISVVHPITATLSVEVATDPPVIFALENVATPVSRTFAVALPIVVAPHHALPELSTWNEFAVTRSGMLSWLIATPPTIVSVAPSQLR
jgi:hypothetical protein